MSYFCKGSKTKKMKYEDLTTEEYAERLLGFTGNSIVAAEGIIDLILNDLRLSMSVCMDKENQMHPHAQGIIAYCMSTWVEIKEEIKNKNNHVEVNRF